MAALISDLGVLPSDRFEDFYAAYYAWSHLRKSSDRANLWQWYKTPSKSRIVKACAVWDTVSSLHFQPTAKHLEYIENEVPAHLENAFHALALQEERTLFAPAIWTRCQEADGASKTLVKQCWFRGMHSHVGGSIQNNNIANLSLVWMVDQLRSNVEIDFDLYKLRDMLATQGGPTPRWQRPMYCMPCYLGSSEFTGNKTTNVNISQMTRSRTPTTLAGRQAESSSVEALQHPDDQAMVSRSQSTGA